MMNLDVPYEQLPTNLKVEYIPLKLAIGDNNQDESNAQKKFTNGESKNGVANDRDNNKNLFVRELYDNNGDNNLSEKSIMDMIVVVLLSFFCILVLLYAIYYFIIIRDRKKPTTFDNLPYRFFE